MSWQMIGEAIEALRGSASEEVISAFILGRHPGVPQAHDRLLRHYLAKYVAEGLFVCTAEGRYSRGSHGTQVTVAKLSLNDGRRQPPEPALVVANEDDPPCPATDIDHDQTSTMMRPTAADATKYASRRPRPCNAAPVHSPATPSNANVNNKKKSKPRVRGRQRKVQDLYDRNPPKPACNIPADKEMWCVLALPAAVRL
jgi:hypothetical protein